MFLPQITTLKRVFYTVTLCIYMYEGGIWDLIVSVPNQFYLFILQIYSTAKESIKLLLLNLLEIKYVEFKKYI